MKEIPRIWEGTCSIENPKDGCLTFARTFDYLKKLEGTGFYIGVCVPPGAINDWPWGPLKNVCLHFFESEFFEYEFVLFHNEFYKDHAPDIDVYKVDPEEVHGSVMVAEGIHISIGPEGKRVQLKHMGNVVFEKGCRVGPLTFIQRATLPGCSTIIKNGALVDGYCTIGHNAVIGENSLIAAGSVVGAGTVIGKNCLIGIHTVIKPHTKICDRVVTGIGSVVIKDLDKPGIYFGNPAVFKKEHEENWMW